MRKLKKFLMVCLIAVFAFALGMGFASTTNTTTAKAESTYTTQDIAMMARVFGWYGNGNFEINFTLSVHDWEEEAGSKTYNGDLGALLNQLDFFNHIKLGEKTLAEWGCTGVYANQYWIDDNNEPKHVLRIPLAMGAENMALAIAAGIGSNYPVSILEGALIPGHKYLSGDSTGVIYRAGCTYVTQTSTAPYGIVSIGKTEVESVKYVQGHDGTCGYFGVSLKGDDYENAGKTEANSAPYTHADYYANHFTTKVKVDGEVGLARTYGLFNLGANGVGYFAFQMFKSNDAMTSVTIPAGTMFPSLAMTTLPAITNNPVYIMYETQTDVTFYKQSNGSWVQPWKEGEVVEKETSVTMAKPVGDADSFTIFALSTHDYPESLDSWNGGSLSTLTFLAKGNFYSHVLIDDVALGSTGEAFLNVWENKGTFSVRTSVGINATKITILAGCQFPTYNALLNGVAEAYVTTEDVTFIKVGDEWTSFSIENYKEEKIAEISAYKNGEFREAEEASRAEAVAVAAAAIEGATDKETVDSAVATAKAAIDALKTNAQYVAEEVAQAGVAAKAEIANYVVSLDDYYQAEQVTINAAIATANQAIDNAASVDEVAQIVANFKATVDAIPNKTEFLDTMKSEMNGYKAADGYFREAEKAQRDTIVSGAIANMEAAEDADAVREIVAQAKASIDALKTAEEYFAEELAALRAPAVAELEEYLASGEYLPYQVAKRTEAVEEGKAAINNAMTEEDIAAALANAKARIDTIAQGVTVKEIAMLARVSGWYGNGNFEINFSLSVCDWSSIEAGQKAYAGSLAQLLADLDFFNHVKLGDKTLAEWGCTACYDNIYWVNTAGEPNNILRIPLSMGAENAALAAEQGVAANYPVTVLEGALLPSYSYLQGEDEVVLYKAGCTYVTQASNAAYSMVSIGKTDIESIKYVQEYSEEYGCGYLGVSLKGDDYENAGQTEANAGLYTHSDYFNKHFTKTLAVEGELGSVYNYGLFNLGAKGVGYYAFQIYAAEGEISTITIPAGTMFPSLAMTTLPSINNGNTVYIMYETQTDVTFVKNEAGAWVKIEDYKAAAISKIDEYRAGVVEADCFTADVSALDAAIVEAKAAIGNAALGSEINQVLASVKASVEAMMPREEVVTNATTEVTAYKTGLFLEAEEASRLEIISEAVESIESATSKVDVDAIVASAKEAIDQLKTAEQYAKEALASMVANAKEELDGYKAEDGLYREAEAATRLQAIEAAKALLDEATTEEAVSSIVADAKAQIDQLKTAAEYTAEEELAAMRENAVTIMSEEKAMIDITLYSEENIMLITTLYNDAVTAVNEATTKEAIDGIVAKFSADLDAVPQIGEESSDEINSGCFAGINGLGSFALAVVMLGAFVIIKKRR